MDCLPKALEPPTKARFADQNRITSEVVEHPSCLLVKYLAICVCFQGIQAQFPGSGELDKSLSLSGNVLDLV